MANNTQVQKTRKAYRYAAKCVMLAQINNGATTLHLHNIYSTVGAHTQAAQNGVRCANWDLATAGVITYQGGGVYTVNPFAQWAAQYQVWG